MGGHAIDIWQYHHTSACTAVRAETRAVAPSHTRGQQRRPSRGEFASGRALSAMEFSCTNKETGANVGAAIDNGDVECRALLPADHSLLRAVPGLPQTVDPADAQKVWVPMWALATLLDMAFEFESDTEYFPTDAGLHLQTAAYALDTSQDLGYTQTQDGEPKIWASESALAHDIGLISINQRLMGTDVAPWTMYDEDVVSIGTAAFDQELDFLNNFSTSQLQ